MQLFAIKRQLAPWLWVPVLMVASIAISLTATLDVAAFDTLIPLAALLGCRYGRRGIAIVALGGLLLPMRWTYEALSTGPHLDVYIAALLVCALAGTQRPLNESVPAFRTAWTFPALLVLPLSVGLYSATFGQIGLGVIFDFEALLYLFLFVAGLSSIKTRTLAAAVAVFAISGVLLEMLQLPQGADELLGGPNAELPLVGFTDLRFLWAEYKLDSPAAFFTALAWLLLGRRVASIGESRQPAPLSSYWSYVSVGLVALLGLGWDLNAFVVSKLAGVELQPHCRLLGAFYAVPCAALMGALLLRYRGVLFVLALVAVFWLLDWLIRAQAGPDVSQGVFNLREPVAALAFGALGIGLRNRLLGTTDAWWSWKWASYLLIVLATLPVFFSLESTADFFRMIAGLVGGVVLGQCLAWLRQRYFSWLPSHGGWVALLGLAAFGVIGWRNREFITQAFEIAGQWFSRSLSRMSEGEGWRSPDSEDAAAVLLILTGFSLLLTAVHIFLVHAADCARDVQALWRTITRAPPPTQETLDATSQNSGHRPTLAQRAWSALKTSLVVARHITVGLAVAYVLVLTSALAYPRKGIIATISAWTSPKPEVSSGSSASPLSTQPKPNPYLWQAAKEILAPMPLAGVDEGKGELQTEWYSAPNESDVRRRITVHVGTNLEPYDLSVSLRRQDRGPWGIWVEQGKFWVSHLGNFAGRDTYPEQTQVGQRVMERARVLAANAN